MDDNSIPWLGVKSPFGGLRLMARSGQGLLRQAEELNEVLSMVMTEEMRESICVKIVNDVYAGGADKNKATANCIPCIEKLQKAKLKKSRSKMHIFPEPVDVLGWVLKKGGFLSPSPHGQCALKNVKEQDIKNIKDMGSWSGLLKMLHIATPRITFCLDPFEQEVA